MLWRVHVINTVPWYLRSPLLKLSIIDSKRLSYAFVVRILSNEIFVYIVVYCVCENLVVLPGFRPAQQQNLQ